MLSKIFQLTCTVLILTSVAQSRAIERCLEPECRSTDIDRAGSLHSSLLDAHESAGDLTSANGRAFIGLPKVEVRVEPIIEPEPITPKPDEPDVPDPSGPPEKPDPNPTDPDQTCVGGVTSGLRRRCPGDGNSDDAASDDGSVGDNADVDPNPVQPGVTSSDNLFVRVQAGDASLGPTNARQYLQSRIDSHDPDEPIPSNDLFGTNYLLSRDESKVEVIKDDSAHQLFLNEGVFQQASLNLPVIVDRALATPSKIFEVQALKQAVTVEGRTLSPLVQRSTFSSDGRIGYADLSGRSGDGTDSAQRLPWFKIFMHLLSHRLGGGGDADSLEAIGQIDVSNDGTIATIDAIFKAMDSNAKAIGSS